MTLSILLFALEFMGYKVLKIKKCNDRKTKQNLIKLDEVNSLKVNEADCNACTVPRYDWIVIDILKLVDRHFIFNFGL